MRIVGVAIGVLLMGGAVIALSNRASAQSTTTTTQDVAGCMNPAAINYNANATIDNGSCIFPSEEQVEQENYQEQQEEQKEREEQEAREEAEREKEEAEQALRNSEACRGLYGIAGNRTGTGRKYIHEVKTPNITNAQAVACHVRKLEAIIYTDKSKYIQGETIRITMYKRKWTDDGWAKWGTSDNFGGDGAYIYLGVKSDDDLITLRNFTKANNASLSAETQSSYSVRHLNISTSTLNISYPTTFKIRTKVEIDGTGFCKDKEDEDTVESAFTVYPAKCNIQTNNAETQQSETYDAEPNVEILSFQSFITPWM